MHVAVPSNGWTEGAFTSDPEDDQGEELITTDSGHCGERERVEAELIVRMRHHSPISMSAMAFKADLASHGRRTTHIPSTMKVSITK